MGTFLFLLCSLLLHSPACCQVPCRIPSYYYNRTIGKKQYCAGGFFAARQECTQQRSHVLIFYIFLTFTRILHSLDFGFYIASVYSKSGETHQKHVKQK